MAVVHFPGDRVFDWETFHEVSKDVFGFPPFYEMNMNAWVDCLTYLDDGMSRFDLLSDEDLKIEVLGSEQMHNQAPEAFQALLEGIDSINQRNSEAGERARIQLELK